MQQGTRTLVAVGVLLTGLTAALLFRHAPSATPSPAPAPGDPLLLRKASVPLAPSPAVERPAARIESKAAPAANEHPQPPAILLPLDPGQPPPELPRSYPGNASVPVTPAAPERVSAPRSHRIVDGDTLGALAERYLGQADRAPEIFALNREVLASPELLPIGTLLRIPPRSPEASEGSAHPVARRE